MMPSEYGSTAPTSGKSARSRYETTTRPPSIHLGALEGACEQLQLGELHRLVDALEDLVRVGTRCHQIGSEPERLRRRVRVLEAARVGHERRVQRLRQLRREPDPELVKDVREQLSRRRRLGVDEVDGAEAAVVVMVVDVDHERCLEQSLIGQPCLLRTVDGEQDALRVVRGQLTEQAALVELEEPVLRGQRRGADEHHDAVLAELLERQMSGEQRSEGIAVGILVRGDEKPVVPAERSDDRAACQPPGSSSFVSGPGSSSSISFVMRTPRSTD